MVAGIWRSSVIIDAHIADLVSLALLAAAYEEDDLNLREAESPLRWVLSLLVLPLNVACSLFLSGYDRPRVPFCR